MPPSAKGRTREIAPSAVTMSSVRQREIGAEEKRMTRKLAVDELAWKCPDDWLDWSTSSEI